MERTTICIEKPLMQRLRARARQERKSLKQTIQELLFRGLSQSEKKHAPLPKLPTLSLGKEQINLSSRARMYEEWDKAQ